jgi:subtilisin family serine protease
MVAGVVGALDNGYGVVGVAPGARIWSVRVLDEKGAGTDANLLCGLDWVMAHRNRIDVANLSLGDTGATDGRCGLANRDPIHWAICHLVDRGRVVTGVAAGNGAADAAGVVPAAYPQVVTVSSMADSDGQPGALGGPTCRGGPDDSFSRSFSNYGRGIDLAAPGECVGSLFPGGAFGLGSGTSVAAPHVAGAAALYRATHPKATPAQTRSALVAHRERIALPGDPDGTDEGVVNVDGW